MRRLLTVALMLGCAAGVEAQHVVGGFGLNYTPAPSTDTSWEDGGVATPSSNLVTNGTFTGGASGWTLGSGGGAPDWAYGTNNVTHGNGGGTAALQPTPALTVVAGQRYAVKYTVSGYSAGSIVASIGGVNGGTVAQNTGGSSSYGPTSYDVIVAGNTTNLKLTPTTTFVGTIDDVEVYLITEAPLGFAAPSTGSYPLEFRTGNQVETSYFMGYDAGVVNFTEGLGNVGIGANAMLSNTTGYDNTALGRYALKKNTIGYGHVAIGAHALENTTAGSANTAIGPFSQFNVTLGYNNTSIGKDTLYSATTGSANVVFGGFSARLLTTGSNNLIAGASTAIALTIGSHNVILGGGAMQSATSGSNNVVIGQQAGYKSGATPSTANAITTAGTNTFVGAEAGFGSATQRSNSGCIGYQCYVDASNTFAIGDENITDVLAGSAGQAVVTTAGIKVGSNAGISGTVVVKGSDGNNCNLVFEGGIVTSETCP